MSIYRNSSEEIKELKAQIKALNVTIMDMKEDFAIMLKDTKKEVSSELREQIECSNSNAILNGYEWKYNSKL